ncbi:DUF5333 domain-containing protein [Sedimentitalea todarodis]|uniref:DUF5333 domain-containing protein n=1 Tax=Sedimentitalea todarodis TaxID=1631240 RepID=A0ABU3V922_9RHOB|nr:DUF5333 domain-containing protein [Sedimentitalea todarodis]MDU9002661.1 DUF5333 domain-containing protein [Sedimentitalea todarodis]
MNRLKSCALALAVCAAAPAVAANSKPPLSDVPEIEGTLFVVAVASEVGRKCDTLAGRRLKGYNMLFQLRRRANQLGYTDAEIRAYVESDREKDRMRAKGEKYLESRGVDVDKPETFCAFGRAEIAKSSAIGALLKAR